MLKREEAVRPGAKRCLPLLFLFVLMLFAGGFSRTVRAEVPEFVQKGLEVHTYPWKTGNIKVYEDPAGDTLKETLDAESLRFIIKGYEGRAFYCAYKVDGKTHKGWISQKKIQVSLTTEKQDAMLRYEAAAYRRPSGVKMGMIPAYTDIDIIGKKGAWYQVAYPYKQRHYIAWITEADYKKSIRIFDGTEKKLMAEGVYTLRPAGALTTMVTVKDGALATAAAKKKAAQRFEFRFAGENCYQILYNGSTLAWTAEVDEEGNHTGNVILEELEAEETPEQIWQLVRKGAYYYLKNKGTALWLTQGTPFTTKKYKASRPQKFRITMVGKNTGHWQVFSQYDSQWAALKYGKTNTMAASACGVFSSVNAVYALNGQFMDPELVAAYAVKTGYRVEGSGTDYRFVQAAANHFGKYYGYAFAGSTNSLAKLKAHLEAGGTAVVYVPHHYIAVSEYKNGKYLVLDPYATTARETSPFGCWVSGSRFLSGTLRAQNYLLLKATD